MSCSVVKPKSLFIDRYPKGDYSRGCINRKYAWAARARGKSQRTVQELKWADDKYLGGQVGYNLEYIKKMNY